MDILYWYSNRMPPERKIDLRPSSLYRKSFTSSKATLLFPVETFVLVYCEIVNINSAKKINM